MRMLHKETKLSDMQGVLFADPSHPSGTWCRYELNAPMKGWMLNYYGEDCVEDGYRFTNFTLTLADPEYANYVKPSDDLMSLIYPVSLSLSETTVGLDTACVYMGPMMEFDADEWQPSCALRTGSDGEFGVTHQLSEGEEVVAVVLFGMIDGHFGTKESVWDYLKATFGIRK